MTRWAPKLVSAVGVLGLTLAIFYVFAVVVSFRPEGAPIADVMIGRHSGEPGMGLLLVAIPYVLIVIHLMMRTRLSHWLASQGAHDEARSWASERLDASFIRGKTEAESNRSAMLRSLLGSNRVEDALDLLREYPDPQGYGSIRVEGIFWRLQTALRNDDLVTANRLAALKIRGRNKTAGDVEALAAVIAAREGKLGAWRERLERAEWRRASEPMVGWALATGCARFELTDEARDAIALVESGETRLDEDVPGRRPERLLVLSQLHSLEGDDEVAMSLRQLASEANSVDPRSRRILSE